LLLSTPARSLRQRPQQFSDDLSRDVGIKGLPSEHNPFLTAATIMYAIHSYSQQDQFLRIGIAVTALSASTEPQSRLDLKSGRYADA
jgi:hypothetical protein